MVSNESHPWKHAAQVPMSLIHCDFAASTCEEIMPVFTTSMVDHRCQLLLCSLIGSLYRAVNMTKQHKLEAGISETGREH